MAFGIDELWLLVAAALVFLMQGGFVCLEVGLVRPRNVEMTAMKNVIDWSMVGLAFPLIGFGLLFGADAGGLVGTDRFALGGVDGREALFFVFQLGFAATTVTIVSGALAERTSFIAYGAASFCMAALIYPIAGHWVWNEGGWLAQRGFVDFAGSTVVHAVGGTMALVGAWRIGPRLGRFGKDGAVRPMPGSNIALSALGALLLWIGWWGFNGGSTLALDERVPAILLATNLAGSAGAAVAFLHARFVQRERATERTLGGLLGGLVAITASCHLATPLEALAIGAIGGWVHNVAHAALLRARIDDPVGAVPVHLACGALGTLVVPLVGDASLGAWGIQLVGVSACIAWAALTSLALFEAIRRTLGLRVTIDEEKSGLQLDRFVPEEPPAGDAALDEDELRRLLGVGASR